MEKSHKEIPLIYIYIYARIKKNLSGTPFVRPSYLLEILKRVCRIPQILHYPILQEMERFELIKRINKQSWEVLNNKCTNKLQKYPFKPERGSWDLNQLYNIDIFIIDKNIHISVLHVSFFN